MRRRRTDHRAADAVQELVHRAVVEIRTIAYVREGFDGPLADVDYQEQIRLLADICDTLVPGLGNGQRHGPLRALQYTWKSRDERQRDWIQNVLESNGLKVEDFLAS